jgi:MFS family permease
MNKASFFQRFVAWSIDRVILYGRVKAMVVASVLFTISALGSGFAFSIWDFILWRLLGGVAVGVASVIVPAYIAECSPAAMRGRLGSLQQLAIVLGIFIALLSDYFIAVSAGSAERATFFVWYRCLAMDVFNGSFTCCDLRNGCIKYS